jgi:hypothetical protein
LTLLQRDVIYARRKNAPEIGPPLTLDTTTIMRRNRLMCLDVISRVEAWHRLRELGGINSSMT